MTNSPVMCFFAIEGDNVYFRGLDLGIDRGGYASPLFDFDIAETVAGYLSTKARTIQLDKEEGTFAIIKERTNEKILLDAYLVGESGNKLFYFDFGPAGQWVKIAEIKTPRD